MPRVVTRHNTKNQKSQTANKTPTNTLLLCVLWCCAPMSRALAQTSPADTDARMTRLAQQFSQSSDPTIAAGPSSDTDTTSSDQAGSSDASGTPILSPGADTAIARTPLLRPGLNLENESTDRADGAAWFLQTITALGIVIALALGVRYVYSRMGGKVASYASPVVEVLSRTTVAPRSHVMLLRVGGRVLVVSESSAGMRTLASIDEAQEVADILGAVSAAKPTSISKGFSQFLHKFHDEHEGESDDAVVVDAAPQGRMRESVSGLLARVRSMGREGGAS